MASGDSRSGSAQKGRLRVPRRVRETEWEERVRRPREAAGVGTDEPTVGVALSGGSIRSATFALGVLQTLGWKGVFRLADHLCTVSGGGYIGACSAR